MGVFQRQYTWEVRDESVVYWVIDQRTGCGEIKGMNTSEVEALDATLTGSGSSR